MGGFAILDADGKEVVRASRYYGIGLTNNESESFGLQDTLNCIVKLVYYKPSLQFPVRVFRDNHIIIFL